MSEFDGDETDLDRVLAAVARGEHGAFDLLYEQLFAPISGLARTVLRDPAQAEEVAQEVLLEVWQMAFRYDPDKGSATAWALTIARRRAIDRVRSSAASSARDRRTTMGAVSWDQVSEAVEETLDRERLGHCLDRLSDLQREAIMLAFYGGQTYPEVASRMGVPVGTVKARIRDGLIRLRGCMQAPLPGRGQNWVCRPDSRPGQSRVNGSVPAGLKLGSRQLLVLSVPLTPCG